MSQIPEFKRVERNINMQKINSQETPQSCAHTHAYTQKQIYTHVYTHVREKETE